MNSCLKNSSDTNTPKQVLYIKYQSKRNIIKGIGIIKEIQRVKKSENETFLMIPVNVF